MHGVEYRQREMKCAVFFPLWSYVVQDARIPARVMAMQFPVPSASSVSGSQLPYSSLTTSNSYSHDFGAHAHAHATMLASSLQQQQQQQSNNVSSSLLIASTTTNTSSPYPYTNTNGSGVRSIGNVSGGGSGAVAAGDSSAAASAPRSATSKLAKKRMSGSSMSSVSTEHPNDLTHGLSLLPYVSAAGFDTPSIVRRPQLMTSKPR